MSRDMYSRYIVRGRQLVWTWRTVYTTLGCSGPDPRHRATSLQLLSEFLCFSSAPSAQFGASWRFGISTSLVLKWNWPAGAEESGNRIAPDSFWMDCTNDIIQCRFLSVVSNRLLHYSIRRADGSVCIRTTKLLVTNCLHITYCHASETRITGFFTFTFTFTFTFSRNYNFASKGNSQFDIVLRTAVLLHQRTMQ